LALNRGSQSVSRAGKPEAEASIKEKPMTNSNGGRGYDRRLLAHKVNWEGGVLGALQYGVRSDQIADPALARRWKEIEQLYVRLAPKVSDLQRDLDRAT
jgi:hypothetical protein